MKKEKRVLTLYLILVLAISAPIEAVFILYKVTGNSMVTLMVVPAIVAIVLKLVFYRKQSLLALGFGKPTYYLFAVIIPFAYIGLSYSLYWLFVPGTFAGTETLVEALSKALPIQNVPAAITVTVAVSILANIPTTFGEEAGWRGLMYPIMHKLWGRNKALVISGSIWTAWHLPLLIGGDYMAGAPLLYRVPMFIIQILALNVIVSWLRMKSGSVWPAVLWHISQNFLNQLVFAAMTKAGDSAYFISETGFITTLCAVISAVLVLVFGKFSKIDENIGALTPQQGESEPVA